MKILICICGYNLIENRNTDYKWILPKHKAEIISLLASPIVVRVYA